LNGPSVRDVDWAHAVWEGEGVGARVARGALFPAEMLFHAVTAARSALYSAGVLATRDTAVPALSVGNLTVGGTGKTPLAAYIARRMQEMGARPAVVLRGYGDDEPLVHRTLNRDIPIVVSPDRVAGSAQARDLGCDVAVLDDAFQHRRARRVIDMVVISADAWHDTRRHLLPAGPWREPLSAARRASLVVVTRKAAGRARTAEIAATVGRMAHAPTATVLLDTGELREVGGRATLPAESLMGRSVLAITGIGNPAAFCAQLVARGATVDPATFRDHHRFTSVEVAALAAKATRYDCVGPSRLWYVSQRVTVESGGDALEAVLKTTLHVRPASPQRGRPGLPGPHN
jgi:tetraacyldisaccharide 4'-kinase